MGRPLGSKNKPKVVARKTRAPKTAPVMDVATLGLSLNNRVN